jgi:hypothetical protein
LTGVGFDPLREKREIDREDERLRQLAKPYGPVGQNVVSLYHQNRWLKRGQSGRDAEIRENINSTLTTIPQDVYAKMPEDLRKIVDESKRLISKDVVGQGIPRKVNIECSPDIPHAGNYNIGSQGIERFLD